MSPVNCPVSLTSFLKILLHFHFVPTVPEATPAAVSSRGSFFHLTFSFENTRSRCLLGSSFWLLAYSPFRDPGTFEETHATPSISPSVPHYCCNLLISRAFISSLTMSVFSMLKGKLHSAVLGYFFVLCLFMHLRKYMQMLKPNLRVSYLCSITLEIILANFLVFYPNKKSKNML